MRKPFDTGAAPIPRRWRERPVDNGKVEAKADVATASLASYRLLILLSEAGFGKTVAMHSLENSSPLKSEGRTRWISCGQYTSVEELRRVAFRGPAWSKWRLDGGQFELYLDGFDEFPAPKELAQMIAEELETVARSELSLRIACRTAVWPSTLQQQLFELFSAKPATVGVFELQPFDESELRVFVAQRLDDEKAAAAFLTKVQERGMNWLTSRPLLVELLLVDFTSDQDFKTTRRDVYEKGLCALLKEQPGVEMEKRRAAEHLALEIVLGGTSTFPTASVATPRGAVLASALFTSDDLQYGAFRTCQHRTFAEHLAATALARLCKNTQELERLHVIVDGGVPPQLRELAARLAEVSTVMRDWLVAYQPDVLTSSDPAVMSKGFKREVISAILEACADGRISTHLSGWERTFGNLYTEDAQELLEAWIRGQKNQERRDAIIARRVAMDVAERVHATPLAPALVDVALAVAEGRPDPDPPAARLPIHAGHSFLRMWEYYSEQDRDEAHELFRLRERFRALLSMPVELDKNLEYRGLALLILWPDALDIDTMIDSLVANGSGNFFGSYDYFVSTRLPKSFDRPDVVAKVLERYDSQCMNEFSSSLMAAAWGLRTNATVRLALLQVMVRHAGVYNEIRFPNAISEQTYDRRELARQLIRTIVDLPHDDPDRIRWLEHHLIWLWYRELYAPTDLEFWLDEHSRSEDLDERLFHLGFIRQAIDIQDDDNVRAVRSFAQGESRQALELREWFKWLMDDESLRAARAKHRHSSHQESHPPELSATLQLQTTLMEAEVNPSSNWWRILWALTGRDDSNRYRSPLSHDIFKLWDEMSTSERRRAVEVLRTALNDPSKEFPARNADGTVRRGTLYAVRSLALLARTDDDPDLGLHEATWRRLAEAVVEHIDLVPSEDAEKIYGLLRRYSPAIGLRLLNSAHVDGLPSIPASRMVDLWTREVSDKILPKLENGSLPIGLDRELLWRLANKGDSTAIQIARDRVVAKASPSLVSDGDAALDATSARQLAGVLALINAPESGDDELLDEWVSLIERNSGVAYHLAAELGRDHFDRKLRLDKIPAQWLLRAWRCIDKVVPPEEEQNTHIARLVDETEYARMGRKEIITTLRDRASSADVVALRTLAKECTSVDFGWMANEAEQRRRHKVWTPLTTAQLQLILGELENRTVPIYLQGSRSAEEPIHMENHNAASSDNVSAPSPRPVASQPGPSSNALSVPCILILHADDPKDSAEALRLQRLLESLGAESSLLKLSADGNIARIKEGLATSAGTICVISQPFVSHADVRGGAVAKLLRTQCPCALRVVRESCQTGPTDLWQFPAVDRKHPSDEHESVSLFLADCRGPSSIRVALGRREPRASIQELFPDRIPESEPIEALAFRTESVNDVTTEMNAHKIFSVEGAAWTGKSVAVRYAAHLNGVEPVTLITCGLSANEPKLSALIENGFADAKGLVRIDEIHMLAPNGELRSRLSYALKAVKESGRPDLRVVLLGQPLGDVSLKETHLDLNLPAPIEMREATARNIRDELFLTIMPKRSGFKFRYPGLFALAAGGNVALAWRLAHVAVKRQVPRAEQLMDAPELISASPADVLYMRDSMLTGEAESLVRGLLKAMGDVTDARLLVFNLLWQMGSSESDAAATEDLGNGAYTAAWPVVKERLANATVEVRRRVLANGSKLHIFDALAVRGLPMLDWEGLTNRLMQREVSLGLVSWARHERELQFTIVGMVAPVNLDLIAGSEKFESDEVLSCMRGNGAWRSVFILGCHEKRVSFIAQQSRAINLAYALDQNTSLKGKRVSVIGGGIGGVTAAVAFGLLGAKVTLFEEKTLLHLQKEATERWLHPGLFEWPGKPLGDGDAHLPFLNWTAGKASTIRDKIHKEFDRLTKSLPSVVVKEHASVNTVKVNNGKLYVRMTENQKDIEFDFVVVAVGFGIEQKPKDLPPGCSPSYWEKDGLGFSGNDEKIIMVSGGGDGALVDLVRAVVPSEDYSEIVRRLAKDPEGQKFAKKIEEAGNYNAALDLDVPFDLFKTVFGDAEKRLRTVKWNAPDDGYRPETVLLHRVLLHLLISAKKISVFERGKTRAEYVSTRGKVLVSREDNPRVQTDVDIYIARWGANRPVLLDRIDEVLQAVSTAGETREAHRRSIQTVGVDVFKFFADLVQKHSSR